VTPCTGNFITHSRTLTGATLTLRAWVGFFISGPMMRRNHTGPIKTIMSTTEFMYCHRSPFLGVYFTRRLKSDLCTTVTRLKTTEKKISKLHAEKLIQAQGIFNCMMSVTGHNHLRSNPTSDAPSLTRSKLFLLVVNSS
jgi:hypothetical protein